MHVVYVYCPWLLNILLLYNLGAYPGFLKGVVDPAPRSGVWGNSPQPLMNYIKLHFDLAENFNIKINTAVSFTV